MSSVTASAETTLVHPPLEVPQEPPRVGINDPGFENLTTAEKLNDSDYRRLVYQTHPDEATCACEPPSNRLDGPRDFPVCRSGCNDSCCWRMRQSVVASYRGDNANEDDEVPFVPAYCVGNKRDAVEEGARRAVGVGHNGDYCCGNSRRLRGGGEGCEERGERGSYPRCGRANGTMLGRLGNCGKAGGVAFEYAERLPLYGNQARASKAAACRNEEIHGRYPGGKNLEERARRSYLERGDPCRTSGYTDTFNEPVPAACVCPGRETLGTIGRRREPLGNKRLPVIESLVKAFEETQDFVNNLGKVPGLAGLGLMDPAESPYFGRTRKNESDLEGTGAAGTTYSTKSSSPTALPNPQCTGPCNAEALRSMDDGSSISPTFASPIGIIGLSGRGGVVREALPSMPEPGLTFPPAKLRRRNDTKDKTKEADPFAVPSLDTEPSPCGEPRCAAKRRKTSKSLEDPVEADGTTTEKKSVTLVGPDDRKISRSARGMGVSQRIRTGRKTSNLSGRSVDKSASRRSSGRSGRRITSFVYSAGDTYNGEAYSHKNCVGERQRVPGNMGWLWNLNETVGRLKPRPGWRPGAIGRQLRQALRAARAHSRSRKSRSKSSKSSTSRSRSRSAPSRGKRAKTRGDRLTAKRKLAKNKRDAEEEIEPPPTLHIRRKDGTYYVTMYPIKQETMDVPKLEEPMKPLQFKIAKNKDDASVATSSTASDMEIEFSPPAAVNRYRRKPNVIHVETQVRQQEIVDALKVDDGIRVKNKKKTKTVKQR